jgi:hypothetical protein
VDASRGIWLDPSGQPYQAPPGQDDIVARAVLTGAVAFLLEIGLLYLVYAVARLGLDRRRVAAWDSDWAEAEARWCGPKR